MNIKIAGHTELTIELERMLKENVLSPWYPTVVDSENGGFLTTFTNDWKAEGPQDKILIHQCRHLYSLSNAFMFLGDKKYLEYAEHGFEFIKEQMWDEQKGGFYEKVAKTGEPVIPESDYVKSAYGNAFAIYGLAVYYKASKDEEALKLAQQAFSWLEKYSYDPQFGGYIDLLNRDGSWKERRFTDESCKFMTRALLKDHNSSIHLMEAFSELYKIWPDTLLKQRLQELLSLIVNTFTTEQGFMVLHFERDWTPVSMREATLVFRENNQALDHVSFGHDIETAYLILEAKYALKEAYDKKILEQVKKMVDHSINCGWDFEFGGLFYAGWYDDDFKHVAIIDKSKVWWTQAESLNSLLLVSRLFPSDKLYFEKYLEQWNQIRNYQVDYENGGWYEYGTDRHPERSKYHKSHEWKATYHVLRSLINSIKILRNEHELLAHLN